MSLLTRYIVSAYIRIFALCTGSFVVIYLVIDFLDKFGRFSRAGGSAYHIGLFFLWKIPEIVTQIMPLAVLMATLMTLGGLSRASELTAMRSCGISLVRITAPLLVLATAVSVMTLLAGELLIPYSIERTRYIEDVLVRKKNPSTFFRQHNIWFRDEDTILQARFFDPARATLKGITLWRLGPGMVPAERIEASQATLQNGRWLLHNVVGRSFAGGNVTSTTLSPASSVGVDLKLTDLKVMERYADNMGFLELRRYTRKLREGGYDATRYLAQMHSRLSLPFAALIMGVLGIPFALRGGRTSGIALGIGVSLGIGFSYLIVNAVLLSFGQSGALSPVVSAWAANFLFAAAGAWLSMTINR